jgi:hypothetical protein
MRSCRRRLIILHSGICGGGAELDAVKGRLYCDQLPSPAISAAEIGTPCVDARPVGGLHPWTIHNARAPISRRDQTVHAELHECQALSRNSKGVPKVSNPPRGPSPRPVVIVGPNLARALRLQPLAPAPLGTRQVVGRRGSVGLVTSFHNEARWRCVDAVHRRPTVVDAREHPLHVLRKPERRLRERVEAA